MTRMQKIVMSEYKNLLQNPPLRVIAENTGIGQSRVFRLFQGSEMNLKEYQIFKNEIRRLKNIGNRVEELFETCINSLSTDRLRKIEMTLEQNLLVLNVTA